MSARKYDGLTAETIRAALAHVDAHDRETWLRMGMAVKSELFDDGFDLWDAWSSTADNYNEKEARSVWKSIKVSGGVTVATLIREAIASGYRFNDDAPKADDTERERRKEAQRQYEARQRELAKIAATDATALWESAKEVTGTAHPYLQRKQVEAHGLKIGRWPLRNRDGEVYAHAENVLLVPIKKPSGALTSLQAIFDKLPAGYSSDKSYYRDGVKSGSFHMIGSTACGTVAICEGYATGATIHKAMGWAVAVCFDRSNLVTVAEKLRPSLQGVDFVICADNDQFTEGNPGVTDATKAAKAIRARLCVPQFRDTDTEPTDWNDLQKLEGLDAVRRQLEPESRLPANDNRRTDVDYLSALIDTNSNGKPLATIENLREICRRLGVIIRYNVISKEEEILIPDEAFTVDNSANASLGWLISWCARFNMPTGNLGDYVTYLADKNPHNPVANWIQSRPWDGVDRLEELASTITAEEEDTNPRARELKEILIRRWLISAVAAAFEPMGVSAHGVLVLQGDQYLGKTKWFKSLVPDHLGVVQDGMMLRPDDRDSVKQVCSFWLVELGELDATFRKSDIAALKSFITRKNDVLRRAYARRDSQFARRTVFFGSVNPKQFLHDTTGNRRYWTIACKHIDHSHEIDMQQVWAQVLTLYKAGETHFLQPEEMAALNDHNESFMTADPIEERILSRLDWQAPEIAWRWVTTTEVMELIGLEKANMSDTVKASGAIRKHNGGQSRRSNGKNLLLVPPLHSVSDPW
jgi:putative DNA primase/helicase